MTSSACVEIMGMPVAVEIVDLQSSAVDVQAALDYLRHIEATFSTFRPDSEIERLNRNEIDASEVSDETRAVLEICDVTRLESGGYFDARHSGRLDPSGVVKGFGIRNAARLLQARGLNDFVVDAGGDVQTSGRNHSGGRWRIGIRDPLNPTGLVAVVHLSGEGIATSGSYERGRHIYDPVNRRSADGVASVSVIAADVCEADRLATAAYAMGESSIAFLESLAGVEGLVVCNDGTAYCTTGFPPLTSP